MVSKRERERKVRERDEQLKQPLLPPFEHLDGYWWLQVVRDYEQNQTTTTEGEDR